MENNVEENVENTEKVVIDMDAHNNVTSPVPPKNYFIPSILATVLCCPPIGVFGIINAARVERLFANGEYEAAQRSSDNAKRWIKLAIIAWITCVAIYIIVVALFLDRDLPY